MVNLHEYAKNKIVFISFRPFLKGPISLFSQAAALSSENALILNQTTVWLKAVIL